MHKRPVTRAIILFPVYPCRLIWRGVVWYFAAIELAVRWLEETIWE